MYSRLAAYEIFTVFSHTFSVCLFSISKTKKKEYCSNFIPSIYEFFREEGGGHLLKVDAYMYLRLGPYLNKYGKCKVFTWGLHLYMHLPQE